MAATDVAAVKMVGALRYELIEGAEEEEDLDAWLEPFVTAIDGFLAANLSSGIYASVDAGVVSRLRLGGAYLVMEMVTAALKARKVYGTHYAFDSEEAESYHDPLDVEWRSLASRMIGDWIVIDTPTTTFARPVFGATAVIDPYEINDVWTNLDLLLARVRNQPTVVIP